MEFEGNWLEKTLLCWSVIGWPSIENELEAWAPSPWKRPFESAATPGEVSVTRELRDDDGLSSGTFWKRSRSTSVWKGESLSTRSQPPSTVTVLEAEPGRRVFVRVTGTVERTSTSCATAAKPVADTVKWYGLNGRLVN